MGLWGLGVDVSLILFTIRVRGLFGVKGGEIYMSVFILVFVVYLFFIVFRGEGGWGDFFG